MSLNELARALGRRGGRARAKRLSVEEKRRIAAIGGEARSRSLQAARRIAENFRYVAALRDLRGERTKVTRQRTFDGPLPGIRSAGS